MFQGEIRKMGEPEKGRRNKLWRPSGSTIKNGQSGEIYNCCQLRILYPETLSFKYENEIFFLIDKKMRGFVAGRPMEQEIL